MPVSGVLYDGGFPHHLGVRTGFHRQIVGRDTA